MSSYTEFGWTSYAEYRAWEPGRLTENELAVGSLCVAIFLTDVDSGQEPDDGLPVHKYPALIEGVKLDGTRRAVEFTLDNHDLAPNLTTKARFQGGYWLPAHSQGIKIGSRLVIAGFLKKYPADDPREVELQTMLRRKQGERDFTTQPQPAIVGRNFRQL